MSLRTSKMAKTSRNDLEFTIVYSMRLEGMTSTILRRLDKFSSWFQIILGVAVVTNYAPTLTGIAIACIGAYQFVAQPGIEGVKAAASEERWRGLYRGKDLMDDLALQKEITATETQDTKLLGGLRLVAHYAAARQMDLSTDELPPLSMWQKTIEVLAT